MPLMLDPLYMSYTINESQRKNTFTWVPHSITHFPYQRILIIFCDKLRSVVEGLRNINLHATCSGNCLIPNLCMQIAKKYLVLKIHKSKKCGLQGVNKTKLSKTNPFMLY